MNEHTIPAPPGEPDLDASTLFPPELALRVASNMQAMHKIAYKGSKRTREEATEYKRLAIDTVDGVRDWINSPACELSQERKDMLLEMGQALIDETERLPS